MLLAGTEKVVLDCLTEELSLVGNHAAGSAENMAIDELLRINAGFEEALDEMNAIALESGVIRPDGLSDARQYTRVGDSLDILESP